MDNKLNLSYSTVSPIATPKPVEESRDLFDTLEEKELRNRAAVNQHLERLNVDVGPSIQAQDYINQSKQKFTNMVQEYANRGDYAYMGRALQNSVDEFTGDRNIRNLASYWTETSAAIDAIKKNDKIPANHRAIITGDTFKRYDPTKHVDIENQIYERPNIQTPFETVKVPELLLSTLNNLKATSSENGFYSFLDMDGNKVNLPEAAAPFIHNESTGKAEVDPIRAGGLVRHMLENNQDAMGFLVQDYVVKNKDLYGDQPLMEVVNGILDGSHEHSDIVTNDIIDAQTNELVDAYSYKSTKDNKSVTFVPGMNDKGSRASKPEDLPTGANTTSFNVIGTTTDSGSNLREHKTNLVTSLKLSANNLAELAQNKVKGVFNKIENGVSKEVQPVEARRDFADLEQAMYFNDPETIERIASSYGATEDKKRELKDQATAYSIQNQLLRNRYDQARTEVSLGTSDPEIKKAINFEEDPELIITLNNAGLTIDDLRRIGGLADITNLDLLIKAIGIISDMDATTKATLNTQIGGNAATGVYNFTRSLVNSFAGRNYEDVDANLISGLTPILSKVDINSLGWTQLKEYREGSKWRDVKNLEKSLQESVESKSINTSTAVATNISYAGILPDKESVSDFETAIASRLTQTVFNKDNKAEFLSNTRLLDATGRELNMDDMKLNGTTWSDILSSTSKDNIKVTSIIPSSMLMDDAPLIKFSIEYKDKSNNSRYLQLSMPATRENGVTNSNTEAYKNDPDYVINSMKNTLNRTGLQSLDFDQYGVRAQRDASGNIIFLSKSADGSTHFIPTSGEGDKALKKRIINTRMSESLLNAGVTQKDLRNLYNRIKNDVYDNQDDRRVMTALSNINALNIRLAGQDQQAFLDKLQLLMEATNN